MVQDVVMGSDMEAAFRVGPSMALDQFSAAQLGDKRLTDRLVYSAERIASHPGGSFPDRFKAPADLDGFYNLMTKEAVTHKAVLAPHRERTVGLMRQHAGVVLIIHDTTVLDYSGLTKIEELGQVGDGHGRGYYCHNSLAVTTDRQVLGLAHQILHVRRRVPKGEGRAERRVRPDRESRLWKTASEAIPAAPLGQLWVDVADRGADILEFLDYEEESGKHYLVRSQHNRKVSVIIEGKPQEVRLHDHVRAMEPQGQRDIEVPSGPGRAARTTTVGIAWQELHILPPRQTCGEERHVPLRVWAVRVWELNPAEGVEPLEWILLTNVSVETVTEAFERVDWYKVRWIIEEYHKAQKTGCDIEGMQFRHKDRLQPAIALLSVVAVWLLQLRDASRKPETQKQPAVRWIPKALIELLSKWRHGEVRLEWTLEEFFLALARMGGHQNRKHDHRPGWLVLWRGWSYLQAMKEGADAHSATKM